MFYKLSPTNMDSLAQQHHYDYRLLKNSGMHSNQLEKNVCCIVPKYSVVTISDDFL